MPQAIQPKGAIDSSRLERYLKRYPGEGYLWLACHAAFFVALTPGLLYRLWVNFKVDEKGKPLDIPLDAVSGLLNSSLCRSLGQGVYEIHESLRDPLLNHLRGEKRFSSPRLYRLARFLLAYLDYCGDELPSPAFAEAQRWTAEAYLKPELAAQRLLEAFTDTVDGKAAASSVEVYLNWISTRGSEEERTGGVDPLAVAEQLVRGMRNYQKGARDEAIKSLKELADHITTGGSASSSAFRTKIPEDILALIKPGPGVEVELEKKGTVKALLVVVGKTASGQFPELEGPANDLELIQDGLKVLLEGRTVEASVLQDNRATRENVLRQWRAMCSQAKPEDHLLFYFSGHAENKRNDHYLILHDYEEQRISKVESIRTVTGGVIYEYEFREASEGCRGFITLVLDTHAGGENWLDLRNDKNVILSATLPGQVAYEQRFEGAAHGLFSKALTEVLAVGRYRSNKWLVRKAAEWIKATADMQQTPLVLGALAALRRPILGQGLSEEPSVDFLMDLLEANGCLERRAGQGVFTLIEAGWARFMEIFSITEELDLTKRRDVEKAIGFLEKALLFRGQEGLSIAFPAMPDAERELFQLELSLEELLNLPVHINRKKRDDGNPATR
ncbi:MAG: caspase family protein [Phaeodactylibacter sp.]|nr:caspase family protein [Phaeodactylibacter sp.]